MRTISTATAVLGVVATLLTTAGATTAATGYDARASMAGHRTCTKTATTGITRRTIVLDNTRSARRVQFKVVRDGDRFADPTVYVWVPAHGRKSVTVSVPQRTTASVRVRVPEMGRGELRLSTTVAALASCYVATVKPKASLGGVSCHGKDSVAQIVLDNRSTSDDRIAYTVESSYGASSASLTVRPASSTNYYLSVPTERSTHVAVTAAGRRVLSIDVAAASCP
ncbi:hypothetical protein ABLE68_03975 [Nocardioides sp. CN2-186]|uniref:hypothetical protein n=1 Tax=Nocardioides tweenelious TaxID=3156607 RepID=UPI0032B3C465